MLDELAPRCRFPDESAVVCAVSGGPDSIAMLALACHLGHQVEAVHVDHGLYSDGARETAAVAAAAGRFGARWRSVRVDVADGPNLEERARDARRAALPADVLTGHTADDQAETVVLHLLRGGGLAASAGMDVRRRPIIDLRRHETRALCDDLGLEVVDDPSNQNPRFRRNRVRHEVMPLLSDVADRDVVPLLARAAAVARDDVHLLDRLAADLDPTDVAQLRGAEAALRRRAIRRWLTDEHPPSSASVERVLEVIDGTIKATEVEGGRRVARSAGVLRIVEPGASGGAAERLGSGE